jgi:hypothetical protein
MERCDYALQIGYILRMKDVHIVKTDVTPEDTWNKLIRRQKIQESFTVKIDKYHIYSKARRGFLLEIWHQTMWKCLKFRYEVPNCTAQNQFTPNRTMQSLNEAYCHVRFALFRDITQGRVVIPYLHSGATYQSRLQRSTNQNKRKDHDWG